MSAQISGKSVHFVRISRSTACYIYPITLMTRVMFAGSLASEAFGGGGNLFRNTTLIASTARPWFGGEEAFSHDVIRSACADRYRQRVIMNIKSQH